MKIEMLQKIERNKTVDGVLQFLSNKSMISNDTGLESFKAFLIKRGYTVNYPEFLTFFKQLEEVGVGKIIFDGQKAVKFIWSCSIQDVAIQILNPNSNIDIRHPRVDREAGNTRAPAPIVLPIPASAVAPAVLEETLSRKRVKKKAAATAFLAPPPASLVTFVFTKDDGSMVLLNLAEGERIATQVAFIRSTLK